MSGRCGREPQVKPLDESSQLLLKAATAIERNGWCQNKLFTPAGQMCLNGALWIAAGRPVDGKDDCAPFWAAKSRMERKVGHIPSWNDCPQRTQEEVVAKLRAVALGG